MTKARPAQRIEMIPVDRVTVINPRLRNKKAFREIVENVAMIGLKRPITVTRRLEAEGAFYDLVCGQGRLEAYKELGQVEVPALVVSADPEDCLIASLVENCARRQHGAIDLLQDLQLMQERGYSTTDIARKTGLSADYVANVIRLLKNGEQRLLRSVESGTIPMRVAMDIADAPDHDVQAALTRAYESGLLKGRRLIAARKLIENRRRWGKGHSRSGGRPREPVSADALVQAYQEEAERKRALIARAEITQNRLMLITEAMRRLCADDDFLVLLEAEGLTTLPERIAERIQRPVSGQS